jgi:hypothetical protein
MMGRAGAAVDAYNAGLGPEAPSASIAPWLAPAGNGQGARTFQAGIAVRF